MLPASLLALLMAPAFADPPARAGTIRLRARHRLALRRAVDRARQGWPHDADARRRGNDLEPLLPLVFSDATLEARHVRHDFWRTLSAVAADNFIAPHQQ